MSEFEEVISPTVEQSIGNKWKEVSETASNYLRDGESYVREEPLKAVAYATAAGYVLRMLPLGAILRSTIGLVLFTVKPAAVVYGAAKAYELLTKKSDFAAEGGIYLSPD